MTDPNISGKRLRYIKAFWYNYFFINDQNIDLIEVLPLKKVFTIYLTYAVLILNVYNAIKCIQSIHLYNPD